MSIYGKHSSERNAAVPISEDLVRIVFLFPSLARGWYWQPVLAEFIRLFPNTIVLTGIWEGFLSSYQGRFQVKVVGRTWVVQLPFRSQYGYYPRGFVWAPICGLIRSLWHAQPQVVFTSAFSVWTFLACMLKRYGKWKLVILYDGSSPSVDRTDSQFTLIWRRFLARRADAFVTNSRAGKEYLVKFLTVPSDRVFVHPYEVPDPKLWRYKPADPKRVKNEIVFITVGQLIERKGLRQLIEAVRVLHEHMPEANFTLLIVGSGPLRAELEEKVKEYGLNDRIKFIGQVEYERLGCILQTADVFVFPTLEDVWGVAPLEAMVMGKPVICSKYAGVRELIRDNVNGYVVDPMDTIGVAQAMKRFIENPRLIEEMGCSARSTMSLFTPRHAAQFLSEVVVGCLQARFSRGY